MKLTTRASTPWGLTIMELNVLVALLEHGEDAAAAAALEVKPDAVDNALSRARVKMRAKNRTQMIVKFARWHDATLNAANATERGVIQCVYCRGLGFRVHS